MKSFLNNSTGERRSLWHKHVQIAAKNTMRAIRKTWARSPQRDRIPCNNLEIKLGLNPECKKDINEDLTDEQQKQIAEIHTSSCKRQPNANF